jgi:uncharacterized protein (DUF1684 family)
MKVTRTILSAFIPVCAALILTGMVNADTSYKQSVEKWRHDYEAGLKTDFGWLSVSGLFWLHEGENRFGSDPLNDIVLPAGSVPAVAGYFDVHAGKTVVHLNPGVHATRMGKAGEGQETAILVEELGPEDGFRIGNLVLVLHGSGDRPAIRLLDNNSKLRKEFAGLQWYPIDESYRVTAHYVPYDSPKPTEQQNILGDTEKTTFSGYVTFSLHGQSYRLEAEAGRPTGRLRFVFRDLTSGKESYPAARFLATDPPKDGVVELDFNKAYNPPCAYNPYTTCPLPLPGNRLHVEIPAGEKNYKGK